MSRKKRILSIEVIDEQSALELPERELLTPPISIVQSAAIVQTVTVVQVLNGPPPVPVMQCVTVTQIATTKHVGPGLGLGHFWHQPPVLVSIACDSVSATG